jgi:transposase
MRRPASIKPWMSAEDLQAWVREAASRAEYQRRLAIWLTHIGPFAAQQVATLLGVSKQAVWLWVSQYNRQGPAGLERQGRGGRRWGYLSWEAEEAFLVRLGEQAERGQILTPRQIHRQLAKLGARRFPSPTCIACSTGTIGESWDPVPGMPKPTYAGKRSSKNQFLQEALAERPLPRRGTGAPLVPR